MDANLEKLTSENAEHNKKINENNVKIAAIKNVEIAKLVKSLREEVTKNGITDFEIRKAVNAEFAPIKAVESPKTEAEIEAEKEKEKSKK